MSQIINALDKSIGEIRSKYVYCDAPISALKVGLMCKRNVLLYGVGGHAKSELAMKMAALFYKPEEIFKGQMGAGASMETLLGHLNVAKLMNPNGQGEREYNHEKSFMSRKCAIMEELFDAPVKLLEQLKDIMTSKHYCGGDGTLCYNSQNEIIIACTNVDPYEWMKKGTPSEISSKTAFVDRFMVIEHVVWPNYGEMDYKKLLDSQFPASTTKSGVVAAISARSTKKGVFISPRRAVAFMDMFLKMGIDGIKHSGVPSDILEQMLRDEAQLNKDFALLEELGKIKHEVLQARKDLTTTTDALIIGGIGNMLSDTLAALNKKSAGPNAIEELGRVKTFVMLVEDEASKRFKGVVLPSKNYEVLNQLK